MAPKALTEGGEKQKHFFILKPTQPSCTKPKSFMALVKDVPKLHISDFGLVGVVANMQHLHTHSISGTALNIRDI